MVATHDICIRGSGIVARTLALLLARERLRVALVTGEAVPSAAPDVRAYALNDASRALLDSLRCWPAVQDATPVQRMEVFGDDGGAVHFDAAEQGAVALAWIVDVPALEALLADAVRFQPRIEPVAQPVEATLTVVCEGRASATREAYGVQYEVTPYEQHAIATRLRCARPHAQVARQWFSGAEILAFLPLGGPQGDTVAVVWSVPPARAEALLAEDEAAFCAAIEAASGSALGAVQLVAERARWPLQLARAARWVGPGWALAGDAAHSVHPLSGQGLNLGLADAAALARTLHAREYWRSVGDLRLLRRYERERAADVWLTGSVTDALQRLFLAPGDAARTLRNRGLSGFDRAGWLKHWVAQRAMNLSAARTLPPH